MIVTEIAQLENTELNNFGMTHIGRVVIQDQLNLVAINKQIVNF